MSRSCHFSFCDDEVLAPVSLSHSLSCSVLLDLKAPVVCLSERPFVLSLSVPCDSPLACSRPIRTVHRG